MTASKVIIITGASSGIGAATARIFGAHGWRVVLAARRLPELESLAEEISAMPGEGLAIATDVGDLGSIKNMVEKTMLKWGQIDLLFNNAGFGRFAFLEDLDPIRDVEMQLRVNLQGTIWVTQAVLPQMIARKQGQIINMSSVSGLVATPTYSIYAASKFGVRGFSQALRREVGVFNIKVSAIFPGGVETEFAEKSGSQKRKTGISTPRWLRLTAQDVGQAIYRLAKRPKSIVVLPWMMRYSVWLNNMVPTLVDKVTEKKFVIPERGM